MLRDIQELLVEMLQHDAAKRPDAQTIVDKVELITSKTGKHLYWEHSLDIIYLEILILVLSQISNWSYHWFETTFYISVRK